MYGQNFTIRVGTPGELGQPDTCPPAPEGAAFHALIWTSREEDFVCAGSGDTPQKALMDLAERWEATS